MGKKVLLLTKAKRYGRVFHPTKLLHRVIAKRIIWAMEGPWSPPEKQVCAWKPRSSSSDSGSGGVGGPVVHPGSTGPTNVGGLDNFIGSGGKVSKATGRTFQTSLPYSENEY